MKRTIQQWLLGLLVLAGLVVLALCGCESSNVRPDNQPDVVAQDIYRSGLGDDGRFRIVRLTINGTNYLCNSNGGIIKE